MTTTQQTTNGHSCAQNAAPVWEATEYQTASFEAPAKLTINMPAPGVVEKRAIWIVHGMGQQVPIETLDALAQGVRMAVENNPDGWSIDGQPRAATTKFTPCEDPEKAQVVQRVEINLKQNAASLQLQLHLYEAYWAPLTQGVAKLSDVISFLFDAGLHGLLNSVRPFRRAMFPDDESPCDPKTKEGKVAPGVWNFRIPKRSAGYIVAALLIVASLTVINLIIVAASAAQLKFPVFGSWPISGSWDQLTALTSAITSMALTFGAVLFLAETSKPAPRLATLVLHVQGRFTSMLSSLRRGKNRRPTNASKTDSSNPNRLLKPVRVMICYLSWISFVLTGVAIFFGAIVLALISWLPKVAEWFQHIVHFRETQFVSTAAILFAWILCLYAARLRAKMRSQGIDSREDKDQTLLVLFVSSFLLQFALLCSLVLAIPGYLHPQAPAAWQLYAIKIFGSAFWVWPALIALSKLVRDLIVEYAGDVAIYVTPSKLDRFNEVRDKIKQLALDSLTLLYSGCTLDSKSNPSHANFLYSKVAVIGHSLGSVIAYDALNKLLTLDELLDNQFRVADRTAIFETFGSPLDKTAFFFTFQGTDALDIREQLAASKQPLIQSYERFRKFPWTNVRSSSDIISGELKFYDVHSKSVPGAPVPGAQFRVRNEDDLDAIVPLLAHVEYWKNPTVWKYLFQEITRPINGGVLPPNPPRRAANLPVPATS